MDNRPIALIFVLLLLLPGALAIPRVPSEFRGWVIIDGRYAKDGTAVTVVGDNGVLCGVSEVKDGFYGPLSCQGDDPSTDIIEGAELNEPLTFLVNGQVFATKSAIRWKPGQTREVNLLKGDMEKAKLVLLKQNGPSDSVLMIILSMLVVGSLWLLAMSTLRLLKFVSSRKKRGRWLEIE